MSAPSSVCFSSRKKDKSLWSVVVDFTSLCAHMSWPKVKSDDSRGGAAKLLTANLTYLLCHCLHKPNKWQVAVAKLLIMSCKH